MRRRSYFLMLWIWLAVSLTSACPAHAGAQDSDVKEAVVFNLLAFVDWPANPQQNHEDFQLCIVDDGSKNTFMASLDGKRMRNKTLSLRFLGRDVGDLHQCQAVFVAAGSRHRLASIAAGAHGKPLLIIAEDEQSIQQGATIAMSMAGGRPVFDINLAAARAANLTISSKLLRLARSVVE